MPRKKNLLAFFDKVELGVDAIGEWGEFEKEFYEREVRAESKRGVL